MSVDGIIGNKNVILFDLDGTLAKFPIDYVSMRTELAKYFDKYGKSSSFKPLVDEIRRLAEELHKEKRIPVNTIISGAFEIIDTYEADSINKCAPIMPMIEIYKKCFSLGKRVAIITRNGTLMTKIFLESHSLPMPHVLCTRDDALKLKPELEQFEYVHRVFGGSLDEYLMVGDGWHDKEFAKKSGIAFVDVKSLVEEKNG